MQPFLDDGNLNPGIHIYTFNQFEKQFIEDFPTSETRKQIYTKFCDWFKQLVEILTPRYIWLDGSFLTKKINPNDLDLVIFYRPEDITSKPLAEELKEFIHKTSKAYDCDAYLCLTLGHLKEHQKQDFGTLSIMETYWMGQFAFDRNRRPKGIIEINSENILSFKMKEGENDGFAERQD